MKAASDDVVIDTDLDIDECRERIERSVTSVPRILSFLGAVIINIDFNGDEFVIQRRTRARPAVIYGHLIPKDDGTRITLNRESKSLVTKLKDGARFVLSWGLLSLLMGFSLNVCVVNLDTTTWEGNTGVALFVLLFAFCCLLVERYFVLEPVQQELIQMVANALGAGKIS